MTRGIGWIAVVLVLLAVAGCQWAEFREAWDGPAAGVRQGAGESDGPHRYVPVGTGRWTDADGREHTQTVYARVKTK